jgi:hypothetical protein
VAAKTRPRSQHILVIVGILMTLCNLQSEDLLEGLLQNGRLTFDQLVWRTISKIPDGMSFIEVVI